MQQGANIEYFSNADSIVDMWLAVAEQGEVTYSQTKGLSEAQEAKASSAAFERKRRLLLPSAKDLEALHTDPAVPKSAASAAGALEQAMSRDKRRRIQAAVDAGSESEGDDEDAFMSRAAVRSKFTAPAAAVGPAVGSGGKKKKGKKKRKGAYANLAPLGRR